MIGSIYQKWSFNIYNAGQMKMKKKSCLVDATVINFEFLSGLVISCNKWTHDVNQISEGKEKEGKEMRQ